MRLAAGERGAIFPLCFEAIEEFVPHLNWLSPCLREKFVNNLANISHFLLMPFNEQLKWEEASHNAETGQIYVCSREIRDEVFMMLQSRDRLELEQIGLETEELKRFDRSIQEERFASIRRNIEPIKDKIGPATRLRFKQRDAHNRVREFADSQGIKDISVSKTPYYFAYFSFQTILEEVQVDDPRAKWQREMHYDAKIFATAFGSRCDHLVTDDGHLRDVAEEVVRRASHKQLRVLSSDEFMKRIV